MVTRLLIAALLVATHSILAEITVTLSQDEISELETFQLKIRLEGIAPRDEPDFSALNEDFDVLHSYRAGETRVTNNTFQSFVEWTLVLRPKRVAVLKIPPLEIGDYTTEERSVTVNPMSEELTKKLDEEVFWITKVDRQEQYVHGGIHVERKLYFSSDVSLVRLGRRGLPEPQAVENAHIVDLGVQATSWVPRNGRSYRVHTQEFVIFAEKSGTLSLPQTSVVANINIDDRSVSAIVRTEEHQITILPRPEEYPIGVPWLPATHVVVSDDLGELDLSQLVVGDSFSRRTTIEALESYSTGVPGIEIELPEGIRSYPVTPEFRNEILGNKIIGTRIDEQAFVVSQAGEVQIPDAELVWWNTDKKVLERTIVPGRTFTVGVNPAGSFAAGGSDLGQGLSSGGPVEPTMNASDVLPQPVLLWVVLFAIAGWSLSVIFAGLWFWNRRRNREPSTTTLAEDVHFSTLLKSTSGRDVKEGMLGWLKFKLDVSRVKANLLLQQHPTTAAVLRTVNDRQYGTSRESVTLDHNDIKHALEEIEHRVQQQRSNSNTYWQFYEPT